MSNRHLVVLGGYGNTGYPIARLLLDASGVRITLAGRSLEKARAAADRLNLEFPGDRVCAVYADAADIDSLISAFSGKDLVVVASSTAVYVSNVAEAALITGVDYFDVQFSAEKVQTLEKLRPEIEHAGRCFITDGGFHPGLPAAMVRFAAEQFDTLETANVGSVIQIDWNQLDLSPSTIDEFVGEFLGFRTDTFKDSRWQKAGLRDMLIPRRIDFGGEFGRRYCLPMYLDEMQVLPERIRGLKETGFFVGGFNWFVDWVLSPVIWAWLLLLPVRGLRPMGRLLRWGLDTFSRPPYGTLLRLEARGYLDRLEKLCVMTIFHRDGYMMTAIPAAACLLEYLSEKERRTGLFLQAHYVTPGTFFRMINSLGAQVSIE